MTEATRDSKVDTTSNATQPPAGFPTDLKPGTAETLADIMHDLIGYLGSLSESADKTHAALIAYMERLILLAGGSLTLTFTALASISNHLRGPHHGATHIDLVIASCWLLTATIFFSLVCIKVMIVLRQKSAVQSGVMTSHTQIKLKLLSMHSVTTTEQLEKIQNLPQVYDLNPMTRSIAKLRKCMTTMTWAAQLTLFTAFILLALFLEANITNMLSS